MLTLLKHPIRAIWQRLAFGPSDKQPLLYALLLHPFACLYYVVTLIRNWLFDQGIKKSHKLPGKVISVGNLAVGGTGKTPLTGALIALLSELGFTVAVLTRGYGVKFRSSDFMHIQGGRVIDASRTDLDLPDEARMLSAQSPSTLFIVGPKRYLNAERFLRNYSAAKELVWILDDGFQHRQVYRQIDLVLWAAHHPLECSPNHAKPKIVSLRRMLPRGFLREGLGALRRASAVIITGNHAHKNKLIDTMSSLADKPIFTCGFASRGYVLSGSQGDLKAASDIPNVYAVVGVANPDLFLQEIQKDGIKLVGTMVLGDHDVIRRSDLLKEISLLDPQLITNQSLAIVTTAKDYWRNPQVFEDLPFNVYIKDWRAVMPKDLQDFVINSLG